MKKHYIDKAEFHKSFVQWHEDMKTNPDTRMPEFIGECFILMAEKISTQYNWNQYSWLDDMKGNAIYNCVKYAKTYDINYNSDPFSYFTSAINNIFLQTRNKNIRELEKIGLYKENMTDFYYSDVSLNDAVIISNIEDLKVMDDILSLEKNRCEALSDYVEYDQVENNLETIDTMLSSEITNFDRESKQNKDIDVPINDEEPELTVDFTVEVGDLEDLW